MDEQLRAIFRHTAQPQDAIAEMSREPLVLSPCPIRQFPIYLMVNTGQGGVIEAAVVVPPAAQHWIISVRQILNSGRRLPLKLPTPDPT